MKTKCSFFVKRIIPSLIVLALSTILVQCHESDELETQPQENEKQFDTEKIVNIIPRKDFINGQIFSSLMNNYNKNTNDKSPENFNNNYSIIGNVKKTFGGS